MGRIQLASAGPEVRLRPTAWRPTLDLDQPLKLSHLPRLVDAGLWTTWRIPAAAMRIMGRVITGVPAFGAPNRPASEPGRPGLGPWNETRAITLVEKRMDGVQVAQSHFHKGIVDDATSRPYRVLISYANEPAEQDPTSARAKFLSVLLPAQSQRAGLSLGSVVVVGIDPFFGGLVRRPTCYLPIPRRSRRNTDGDLLDVTTL